MGKTMEALLKLQSIERQLAQVRSQLKTRSAAVDAQQARVSQAQAEYEARHEEFFTRQKQADAVELQLKEWEERITKLRGSLNTAKTNKEYAALLTQINTLKADNSKVEEDGLRLITEVDEARTATEEAKAQIAEFEQALEEVKQTSAADVTRLEGMLAELQTKRDAAAQDVPAPALTVFNRIASMRDGEAMSPIEIQGRKPPFEYICGGCFMSITAEHANSLQTRDDLRFCDCCGRILYLEAEASRES